jgi:outer membrane protein assembly factor BamB
MMKISSLLKYGDSDKNKIVTEAEWAAETETSLSLEFRDRFVAIRPGGQGNATDTHVVWETTKGLNEMPSPLYYRGHVYIVTDGGRLTALTAGTGERAIDRKPFRASGQYVGSPIAANGFIYLTSERGTISVVRHEDELEVIANNKLDESIKCTPAIAGNSLVVRTEGHLWHFGG